MVLKKSLFISVLLFFFISSFTFCSLAFDQDSVYVWSNFDTEIFSSISPYEENINENTNNR